MKTYRFQTIVVEDHARAMYTEMRDELKTTDKGLFAAMMVLLNDRKSDLTLMAELAQVINQKAVEVKTDRELKRTAKLALNQSAKAAIKVQKSIDKANAVLAAAAPVVVVVPAKPKRIRPSRAKVKVPAEVVMAA